MSRVSLELFYFEAAYNLVKAPYVNTWTQSPKRPDFVSKNKTNDGDDTSFGCAILFIYYLHSQLGFNMKSIVTQAGSTLEDSYKALTGKKGGYAAFTKLLAQYLPIGKTPLLPFDDPFPLTDGNKRSVQVVLSESTYGPPAGSTSGLATFALCGGPTSTYKWTITDLNQNLTCVSRASGFGQPIYNWKINGKPVPGEGSGYIPVDATVLTDNPDTPWSQSRSTQSVTLYFEATNSEDYHGLSSELVIYNQNYPGHILLTIEADVNELYASKDLISGTALGTLDTQKLTYESKYYQDLEGCRSGWLHQFGPIQVLAPWVTLLLTLPDPAPEVLNGAAVLSAVAAEIAAIAVTQPELAQQVAATMAPILNVPVAMLVAATSPAQG